MFRIIRNIAPITKKCSDRFVRCQLHNTNNAKFASQSVIILSNIPKMIVPIITPPLKQKPPILDQRLPLCDKLRIGTNVPEFKKIEEKPVFIKEISEPVIKIKKLGKGFNMLIVRRRKMFKHQARKRAKIMKFVWAKIDRQKQAKKDQALQEEVLAQLKQAEKFNAEQHVQNNLNIVNTEIIQRRWHGKRLPEWCIRELLEKRQAKINAKKEKIERRKEIIAERGSLKVF